MSTNTNMQLDKYDKHILASLQVDVMKPVSEIAEHLSISKSACWRRIQKLEQAGFIRGKVALLDPKALNIELTVYIVVKTNQHNEQWSTQFKSIVTSIPEILEVHRMSGDVDYLIKAMVNDMAGYDHLYKRLIKADLFDVSSSFVMETMKETTELPIL